MFSFAAINDTDTDSRNNWQSLAPTREAQEFHLSQLYHDGLLRLQAKDYGKAQELLESVLKDPLLPNAEEENTASDGHLLQLRFLALKNLAAVFLEQGPAYYENALHCYLQAVDIDSKDSVIWNQLGTLSCSMGSISISRWAFEQGLLCSPNNWICMEKLLEILIAIGDEVACLSVAELILRHWPSHSRALHVKSTIEDSEPVPFTPRGIDKLEPKHIRLKFPEKRKADDGDFDRTAATKKFKQNMEVQLAEVSWISLASELLEVLKPLSTDGFEPKTEKFIRGDARLTIHLPPSASKSTGSLENKGLACMPIGEGMCDRNSVNEKEGAILEEQPQERRSSRLERLRSRKPGKEESVNGTMNCNYNSNTSSHSAEAVADSLDSETTNVIEFIQNTSNNYGAYHISHLLLEKIAIISVLYQDSAANILDLEKVTRNWSKERTPECSLFLAELYYDLGLQSFEKSTTCSSMSEASYHLCKIIESVALEHHYDINGMHGETDCSMIDTYEHKQQFPVGNFSLVRSNHCFWVRFFWLSSRLSLLEGKKEKSQKELSVVLALFLDRDKMNRTLAPICLPHCKSIKKLTVDMVLHEINMIDVDYMLKNSAS